MAEDFKNTVSESKETENAEEIKKITSDTVRQANAILQKYKSGKKNLERRIIENEQWFKMRHWEQLRPNKENTPRSASAWLFNSILNKHADAMDNYPEPNILPREKSDEETAQILSEVLPTILEQNHYESVYSDVWWYKLKTGTGVKGVFWNADKNGGLGDIDIKKIDILNLFWEPGISDIQDSRNIFNVKLVDNDILKSKYPELENLGNTADEPSKYIYDDDIDTSGKSVVVDWYYKKTNNSGKTVLHFVKYVNDTVLYASENEPEYEERGYYDHGSYPFVFDAMFVEEGTPAGFGFIDSMKDCQLAIDELDNDILLNCKLTARPRYFSRDDGAVNEDEFADWSNDFVHINGAGDINSSIVPIQVATVPNYAVAHRQEKINELKETSGNRDWNQGGTSSGVTAASAIASLQEAGNKLSRDTIKASYRAFAKECYLIIELIRQFYSQTRTFRIVGNGGENKFVDFNNSSMTAQPQGNVMGVDLGERLPVFDIRVVPQKANPYAKQAQNELALNLYNSGFFNPQLADQALSALEIMQFDDKDSIVQRISQNQTLYNQVQQLSSQLAQLTEYVQAINPDSNLQGALAQQQSEMEQVNPNGNILNDKNVEKEGVL